MNDEERDEALRGIAIDLAKAAGAITRIQANVGLLVRDMLVKNERLVVLERDVEYLKGVAFAALADATE